jgi:hypothetical protein
MIKGSLILLLLPWGSKIRLLEKTSFYNKEISARSEFEWADAGRPGVE